MHGRKRGSNAKSALDATLFIFIIFAAAQSILCTHNMILLQNCNVEKCFMGSRGWDF